MNFQIITMFMGLLGGLGLLLYGMKLLGDGLELAAGAKMRILIEKLTSNKYLGALIGLIVTAVIQSSAATTVMVVGLVNAGIMNLSQAVGVIMGANIGTTVTGLIIALNIEIIAPIIIFLGSFCMLFLKNKFYKSIGQIILGLGILFLGITSMSSSMQPLSQMQGFTDILKIISNPIIGILVGAAFTALLQSSSVSIGVLQAFGAAGVITLPNAIFVIFGQNIGTCVTSMLSAIGASKTAKRTAVVHLIFNVFCTVFFTILVFIIPFENFVQTLVPNNIMMQIAAVHIIFNLFGTLIMLPISNLLIKASYLVIKGEDPQKPEKTYMYIDSRILKTPAIAVSQIIKEVLRMGKLAKNNFDDSMDVMLNNCEEKIQKVKETEEIIDFLNHGLIGFLMKINSSDIDEIDRKSVSHLYGIINYIERISDYSETICNLKLNLNENKDNLMQEDIDDIITLKKQIDKMILNSYEMFKNGYSYTNEKIESKIKKDSKFINQQINRLRQNHLKRLNHENCTPLSSIVYLDFLTNIEKIAINSRKIGFAMLNRKKIKNKKEKINKALSLN